METTRERNYIFDNLKGILIFLVVFAHYIRTFTLHNSETIAYDIYSFIYLFHMPFFIFISGYFSKKHDVKKITGILIMYVFCQMVLYPLGAAIVTGTSYLNYIEPVFMPQRVYWYLLALALWRVTTPYLVKIKYFIPISFIVGIFFAYTSTKVDFNFMTLGRFISFFPFFLLGYITDEAIISKLKNKFKVTVPVLILIVVLVLSWFYMDYISGVSTKPNNFFNIISGAKKYKDYLLEPKLGWILKAFLYAIQVIFIYATIILLKNKKTILSNLGNASLGIYATHMIFFEIYEMKLYDLYNIRDTNVYVLLAAMFIITLLFCYVLSLKYVNRVFNTVLNFPSKILLKKD